MGSVVGGVALIAIIIAVVCLCCRKKKNTQGGEIVSEGSEENRVGAMVLGEKP